MINRLLTTQQEYEIVAIIKRQCQRFQKLKNQYDSLFYEPYTQMRHKHTVTSAIISGFASGRFQIEGITSIDLKYGLNNMLVQPELTCKNGVFHIYSDGSNLKGKKILEHCNEMNGSTDSLPLFS